MQYLQGTYSLPLVTISVCVSILASYAAFDLFGITWKEKTEKVRKWRLLSAASLGLGIWTMHFIGMFAFKLPVAIHYDVGYTLLSLLLVIITSYLALIVIRNHMSYVYVISSSLIMAFGIVCMHYLGMFAMHMDANMHFNSLLVLVSIMIAVFASITALLLFRKIKSGNISETFTNRILIAITMGIAISGMHYVGMAATSYSAHENIVVENHGFVIEGELMLTIISMLAIALIIIILFSSKIERRLFRRLESETELLRASEGRLRMLIEDAADAFFLHDLNGNMLDVNKTACEKLGYSRAELLCLSVFDLEKREDPVKLREVIWPSLAHGGHYTVDGIHRHKDGSEFPVQVNLTCIKDKGETLIFALSRDMTEIMQLRSHLEKLAMTDELTGIYNRRAFIDCFDKVLSRARRKRIEVSLMMLDIDHFKKINDSYGHDAGDKALCHFVEITKAVLRNEDVYGRIGGEEFGIILPDTTSAQAGILAERLRVKLQDSLFTCRNDKIAFTVSIGISAYDDKETGYREMMNRADEALYEAKGNGRNRVVFYTAQD